MAAGKSEGRGGDGEEVRAALPNANSEEIAIVSMAEAQSSAPSSRRTKDSRPLVVTRRIYRPRRLTRRAKGSSMGPSDVEVVLTRVAKLESTIRLMARVIKSHEKTIVSLRSHPSDQPRYGSKAPVVSSADPLPLSEEWLARLSQPSVPLRGSREETIELRRQKRAALESQAAQR